MQVYFLSDMGLNQNIGVPANLPGLDSPFKGDMEKLVRTWAKGTAAQLLENAQKAKYSEGTIHYSVNDNGITFEFPAYMKFRDMKMLFWTSMPDIEAIQNWVRKGYYPGKFYIPGYKEGSTPGISQEKQIERIAYGVSYAMAAAREPVNNWAKYKRRKIWQNPKSGKSGKGNLGTSIGHLVKMIEEEMAEIIPNAIAYTFSQIA